MPPTREETIKASVVDKKITRLCHVTNLANLDSIIQVGLLSRSALESSRRPFIFNDTTRSDGYSDAICISIMHPNHSVFYTFRNKNPRAEWCVISLSPKILWEKDCAFCYTNAASNEIRKCSIGSKKSAKMFEKMFEKKYSYTLTNNKLIKFEKREKERIEKYYPTDVQAEVLCFDNIEISNIINISFHNVNTAILYRKKYANINMLYAEYIFSDRIDYLRR